MYKHNCILSIVFTLVVAASVYCQTNNNVLNSSMYSKDSIEAVLIRLALDNNPIGKISNYRTQIAERAYKQEKRWPLQTIKLTGNLNEFTLNPDKYVRSQFFPRYNFSVMFTLGDLFNHPTEARSLRIATEITRLEAKEEMQNLKAEVLRRYNRYVFTKERLAIQKKLEAEIAINLELAQSKFNKGAETYDAVSALKERYYNLQITVKEMEEVYYESKVNLEEIIGVNLESVIPE